MPNFDATRFCGQESVNVGCTNRDTGDYELFIYKFGDSAVPAGQSSLTEDERAARMRAVHGAAEDVPPGLARLGRRVQDEARADRLPQGPAEPAGESAESTAWRAFVR